MADKTKTAKPETRVIHRHIKGNDYKVVALRGEDEILTVDVEKFHIERDKETGTPAQRGFRYTDAKGTIQIHNTMKSLKTEVLVYAKTLKD